MSKSIHIEIGESYAGLLLRIGDVNGAVEMSNVNSDDIILAIKNEINQVFGNLSEIEDATSTLTNSKRINAENRTAGQKCKCGHPFKDWVGNAYYYHNKDGCFYTIKGLRGIFTCEKGCKQFSADVPEKEVSRRG